MDVELTKNADKTLCEIYTVYLNRCSSGDSKDVAKDFADKRSWPDPDWTTPDGESALDELEHAGMIKMNIIGGFRLENRAISCMENRFKNGVSEVMEFLGKIASAIPLLSTLG